MINKLTLGAVAFLAAIGLATGLASPASAAHYGPAYTNPGQTGGGSAGYNSRLANDYRLKHHANPHAKDHSR
jgi:opacity protein-like surface antigen